MKLIVHELKDYLEQRVLSANICNVEAIRLHLYKHRNPVGKLKVQILTENNTVLKESEEITITDISSADFFHGQTRFYIKYQLQKDVHYKIRLVHDTGPGTYEFTEAAYVGWCADFDFNTYEKDFVDENLLKSPLDYEVWERK